jgi:hypothetical protein
VVTFEGAPALPAPWPTGWLQAETSGAVVRFVDTRFDGDRIRAAFPESRDIAYNAMPLHAIFVTLAKAGRDA